MALGGRLAARAQVGARQGKGHRCDLSCPPPHPTRGLCRTSGQERLGRDGPIQAPTGCQMPLITSCTAGHSGRWIFQPGWVVHIMEIEYRSPWEHENYCRCILGCGWGDSGIPVCGKERGEVESAGLEPATLHPAFGPPGLVWLLTRVRGLRHGLQGEWPRSLLWAGSTPEQAKLPPARGSGAGLVRVGGSPVRESLAAAHVLAC